jgi:hypothetical protein
MSSQFRILPLTGDKDLIVTDDVEMDGGVSKNLWTPRWVAIGDWSEEWIGECVNQPLVQCGDQFFLLYRPLPSLAPCCRLSKDLLRGPSWYCCPCMVWSSWVTFIFRRCFLEKLAGLGLGVISSEKEASLRKCSICLAPGASPYLDRSLSTALVANSTAATSIRLWKVMNVICRRTAVKLAVLTQVKKAPNLDVIEGYCASKNRSKLFNMYQMAWSN